LLQVGPPEGTVVRGVLASARQHALEVEQLSSSEVHLRWPGFHIPDSQVGVYEPAAGYLDVEQCVIAHAEEALRLGAKLQTGATVRCWTPQSQGFRVQTDHGDYYAQSLAVAAGPWSADVLSDLGLELSVRRKPQYWFEPAAQGVYDASRGYPAFLFEIPEGNFYGLPAIDDIGVKVAEHTGGAPVPDPLNLSQEIDSIDFSRVQDFTRRHLPQLAREPTHHDPCMYTVSADEHFVVDRHPLYSQLVFAAGLSGHGFKFVGVLGKLLAELLLDGKTSLSCEFLSLKRLGLPL
jgi:monomeric sarcosine oxidase